MVLEITGPPILVVMGVAGTGKSTVAGLLAERLNWELQEGDVLHPQEFAKMSAGIPLDDQDRWPWLDAIAAWIASKRERGEPGLVTCSALKRSYRDRLRGTNVIFVFLNGPRAVIEARIASRKGHYMPPSLLDSQLATLEPPTSDENVLPVSLSAGAAGGSSRSAACARGPDWLLLDSAALGCDLGAYGRHDFLGEKSKLVIAVAPEDERVEAVTDREVGELVDPLIDRTAQQAEAGSVGDLAIDVQDPSDVCWLAASSSRGVINASRALAQESRLTTKGRHPPIGKPSGKTQRAWAVHAEPNTDRMHRSGPDCAPARR